VSFAAINLCIASQRVFIVVVVVVVVVLFRYRLRPEAFGYLFYSHKQVDLAAFAKAGVRR
jgi:hypothetical protein